MMNYTFEEDGDRRRLALPARLRALRRRTARGSLARALRFLWPPDWTAAQVHCHLI